jgi:hypothetical protein
MINISTIEVVDAKGLDPIDVYFKDIDLGKGHVTITCYGSAWTSYFGAMGNRTVRQFVVDADVGYLVNKMGIAPLLKSRKRDTDYLSRIILAVKAELAQRAA